MFFRSSVLAAASLTAVAQAQYKIDPETVDMNQRDYWCTMQVETCPLICYESSPDPVLVNECDAEKLTYGCLCGDNSKPNVTEYSQTLPYFVCRQWGIQCVDDCADQDTACQSACLADHPCGASNPKRVTSTSSSASTATRAPSETKTDDDNVVLYTGPSDPENNNNNDNGNAAALVEAGAMYGWAVLFGGVGIGFALL